MRPRKRAAGLLLGSAVLFVIGTNVQAGWLFVLAALLLGALVAGTVLPLGALRGLEVAVDAPAEVHQGSAVPVTVAVRNGSRSMRAGVVVRNGHLGDATVAVGTLRPGALVDATSIAVPGQRGDVRTTTVMLRSAAPFGVAERRRRVRVDARTLVLPRVVPVGRSVRRHGRGRGAADADGHGARAGCRVPGGASVSGRRSDAARALGAHGAARAADGARARGRAHTPTRDLDRHRTGGGTARSLLHGRGIHPGRREHHRGGCPSRRPCDGWRAVARFPLCHCRAVPLARALAGERGHPADGLEPLGDGILRGVGTLVLACRPSAITGAFLDAAARLVPLVSSVVAIPVGPVGDVTAVSVAASVRGIDLAPWEEGAELLGRPRCTGDPSDDLRARSPEVAAGGRDRDPRRRRARGRNRAARGLRAGRRPGPSDAGWRWRWRRSATGGRTGGAEPTTSRSKRRSPSGSCWSRRGSWPRWAGRDSGRRPGAARRAVHLGAGAARVRRAASPGPRVLDGLQHHADRGRRCARPHWRLPRLPAGVGEPRGGMALALVGTGARQRDAGDGRADRRGAASAHRTGARRNHGGRDRRGARHRRLFGDAATAGHAGTRDAVSDLRTPRRRRPRATTSRARACRRRRTGSSTSPRTGIRASATRWTCGPAGRCPTTSCFACVRRSRSCGEQRSSTRSTEPCGRDRALHS